MIGLAYARIPYDPVPDLPFLVGLGVSALAAPFVFRALVAMKSRQTISQYVPEHQQKQGTPTMGGLIILAGLAAALFASGDWVGPLLLTLGFAAIGFLDDFILPRVRKGSRGLEWTPKLLLQFAAVSPAALLVSVEHGLLGALGYAILILAFSNAYNFADGLDGLAAGILMILCVGFITLGGPAPLAMALLGATIPFLFLNVPPARVFMGDVGALPLGALLGHLAFVTAGSVTLGWVPVGVLSLLLAAELIPVPLQIASVKLRKGKRLFPRTPIHHAFQHAGVPETRVTGWFLLTQATLVGIAVSVSKFLPEVLR